MTRQVVHLEGYRVLRGEQVIDSFLTATDEGAVARWQREAHMMGLKLLPGDRLLNPDDIEIDRVAS